ncbi:MAG: SUF system Fe-S cluster assembly regulator [Proteobacteria bacterium]|nr:SUF system Fe-S cluster assembly regulator [Pseudomonadota bacterium]
MKLTNLADYAVVLMCHLAQEPRELSSAVGLAQMTGVPVPTVSKILGALSRASLLRSQRGLKGGFYLGRAAEDISVADIVEAVDGPIALTNCIEDAPGDCTLETLCTMKPHWQVINMAVKGALSGVSLAEIAAPPITAQSLRRLAGTAAELGGGRS